jgi:uncharacterized repeat protein (TIGR01451 family)
LTKDLDYYKIKQLSNMKKLSKINLIFFTIFGFGLIFPLFVFAVQAPFVDLKVNNSDGPIAVPYGSSITLTWTSSNANSCTASGGWSGSKSISGSLTLSNLTSSKTYTLSCSGPGGTDSDSVTVYVQTLILQKWVKNLSTGTNWSDSVYAEPHHVLSFYIQINVGESTLYNVFVKDNLPDRIIYRPNSLKIDGVSVSGNITAGINLGNLSPGQSKIITFDADVASPDKFAFGDTTLINTVSLSFNQTSLSDSATIIVRKRAVARATGVTTGKNNNFFLDYLLLPLIIILATILVFKPQIVKIFSDYKRKREENYDPEELLLEKIAQIREKERK